MTRPQPDPASGPTFRNTAKGNAHVGVQGVVNGDVTTYVLGPDPSPEERFEKAKSYLAAKIPGPAKAWLRELTASGWTTNEVLYYWVLAILSERSIRDLEPDDHKDLSRAFTQAAQNGADHWSAAINVLKNLLVCRHLQEETGDPGTDQLQSVLAEYDQLPEDHRHEIESHLDLIITSAIRDRLEGEQARRVRVRRMDRNREQRAWKFFEAVPAAPRPAPVPTLNPQQRVMATTGAVMSAVGGLPILVRLFGQGTAADLVLTVMFVLLTIGVPLVAFAAPEQFPDRFRSPASRRGPIPPHQLVFRKDIDETVQRLFDQQGRQVGEGQYIWDAATHRVRAKLTSDLIGRYSEPRIEPGAVDWLIRWHAQWSFRQWKAGEVRARDHRHLTTACLVLGTVCLGIGASLFLGGAVVQLGLALLPLATLMALGSVLMAAGRLDVYLLQRVQHAMERTAAEQRLNAEQQEYRRWCGVLADRPDDVEMGRWLDDDKSYLLTMVKNQYGLTNTDILERAVLVEPVLGSWRARERYGPWRYTEYVIWLFLLTAAGVRQIAIHLDFTTGIASNQYRTTFRYDAIASAGIEEIGVRLDNGRREPLLPNSRGNGTHYGGIPALILRQSFHLALVNGQPMRITVQNLDESLNGRGQDDLQWLANLALDTTGVRSALHLLEEVTAEGRERIAQARRQRGFPSFSTDDAQEPEPDPPSE
ncbi:MAG: hypothetical protein ACRDOO_12400 [Actinomadura sp.]